MKIRMDDLYSVYVSLNEMFGEKMSPTCAMLVMDLRDKVEQLLKENSRPRKRTDTTFVFDKNKEVDNGSLPILNIEQMNGMILTPEQMRAFKRVFAFTAAQRLLD